MTDFIRTEKCELYCPFCNKAHKGKIGYCGDEDCGGHGIVSSDNCKAIKDEEWLKLGFVKCYHPRINETHLADYILVPFDQVYEHTKELYFKGLSDGQ